MGRREEVERLLYENSLSLRWLNVMTLEQVEIAVGCDLFPANEKTIQELANAGCENPFEVWRQAVDAAGGFAP